MKYTANCPACGYSEQPEFGTCPKCGVIVEKYYAKLLERKQREVEKEQRPIPQVEPVNINAENRDIGDNTREAESSSVKFSTVKVAIGVTILFYFLYGYAIYSSMVFFYYGGGFVVALSLLIWATLYVERMVRIVLCVLSLIAILIQGGCWQLEIALDTATGSTKAAEHYSNMFMNTIPISILICVILAIKIIAKRKPSATRSSKSLGVSSTHTN